jgi:Cu(I)/Ag(I) efflux system membrane fusion protein
MTPILKGIATVAAIAAAAGAGIWAGQHGLVGIPWGGSPAAMETASKSKPSGPIIYYRDPDGRPFYASAPRKTDAGRDYVAVLASEDVNFDAKPEAEAGSAERKIKYYRNPMGLPDTSQVPKKDSMGMDYIPVYEGEDTDDGSVKVSPGKLQRTGVETIPVGKHAITRTIKAPGVVQLDERRIMVVAPRFDGYVIKVGAPTTGTHLKQGDELATVFGQELLNQGARLVVEQSFSQQKDNEPFSPQGAQYDGERVIGASRRLENLDAPQEFINEIRRTKRVPDNVVFRAPMSGIVLERNVVDGQAFKAGDVLFRIADHTSVWMMADVAEGDIDAIAPGQEVTVTTRARPGRTFTGTVTVIYPHLMKETRTARVRIELPNSDLALLPDMYGEVAIKTGANRDVLAVPVSAVIDSGSRQVVLIERGEGRFEPRVVKIGRRGDGYAEIADGVSEGDRVVVNGNFLIDAESNLQAALKAFSAPDSPEVMP